MAGNPRTVTQDTVFTWDGVSTRLARGQAIDVTPDSALERAIGRDRLVPLGPTSALPPAEQPAREAPAQGGGGAESTHEASPSAPVKLPAAGAKKQDTETAPAKTDEKDGDK
jgi:hypothetical protein